MAGQVIFQSGRISITPTIARFDGVSYQVANIGSVRVLVKPLWHPIAILLYLICVGAWIAAYNDQPVGKASEAFVVGLLFGVAGALWQRFWPLKEYVLLLKTSSGDVQAYTTRNHDHIVEVKHGLEEAFNARS
jgi:hypothetical protein